jgi:uncharacterized OB-fold protein
MTVLGARCQLCGRMTFPPVLVCRCGATAWVDAPLDDGAVEALTILRPDGAPSASGPVALATVATADGPMVVARADPTLHVGDRVRLEVRAGAIWALPAPARDGGLPCPL